MEEYVDVFSDKWTKRLKMFGYVRFIVRWLWIIMCCICIVVLYEVMVPYITGEEVWEELPFTLSQLEAILGFLLMACIFTKSMKVL